MRNGLRSAKRMSRGVSIVLVMMLALAVAAVEHDTRLPLVDHSAYPQGGLDARSRNAADDQSIASTLGSFVPELGDVYVEPLRDGGISVVATASLDGWSVTRALEDDVASRFLLAAYDDLPGVHVDYAALYLTYDGAYIMAAGLGKEQASQLSVQTFAMDQGTAFTDALARVHSWNGPLRSQGFVEWAKGRQS